MEENKIMDFTEVTEGMENTTPVAPCVEENKETKPEVVKRSKNPVVWFNGLKTWQKWALIGGATVAVGLTVAGIKKGKSYTKAAEVAKRSAEAAERELLNAHDSALAVASTVVDTVAEVVPEVAEEAVETVSDIAVTTF